MKTIRLMTLLAFGLFTTMTNAQTTNKTENHSPEYFSDEEMGKIKADIAEILQKYGYSQYKKKNYSFRVKAKDILVLDDRIEFMLKDQKKIINISDLSNFNFQLDYGNDGYQVIVGLSVTVEFAIAFRKENWLAAKQMINDLLFIQQKQFSTQLTLFKPIALKHIALKVKPPVSEEQRECIVQANSFNQQKQTYKAIEFYIKAIVIDQTAYPAAYLNLALLSAQANKFASAIYNMKKYLLLEPEASDARSCQDKIYEWKAEIPK